VKRSLVRIDFASAKSTCLCEGPRKDVRAFVASVVFGIRETRGVEILIEPALYTAGLFDVVDRAARRQVCARASHLCKDAFEVEAPITVNGVPLFSVTMPVKDHPPSTVFTAPKLANGVGSSYTYDAVKRRSRSAPEKE